MQSNSRQSNMELLDYLFLHKTKKLKQFCMMFERLCDTTDSSDVEVGKSVLFKWL